MADRQKHEQSLAAFRHRTTIAVNHHMWSVQQVKAKSGVVHESPQRTTPGPCTDRSEMGVTALSPSVGDNVEQKGHCARRVMRVGASKSKLTVITDQRIVRRSWHKQ
jgi:hypothetical protein